jgi:hypothetical protein
MGTGIPKVLLVGENAHGCSYLAQRLRERGCHCEFAASYPETCSSLRVQHFHLVLSPMRLRGTSIFPLIDLLDGSRVTLFFFHPVEQGCWWLPALRDGEKCFGSSALRPSDFVTALDEAIAEIRCSVRMGGNTQQFAVRQPRMTVTPLSHREHLFVRPLRAKVSATAESKAAG